MPLRENHGRCSRDELILPHSYLKFPMALLPFIFTCELHGSQSESVALARNELITSCNNAKISSIWSFYLVAGALFQKFCAHSACWPDYAQLSTIKYLQNLVFILRLVV